MAKELWATYAYWLEVKPARARKMKWNRLRGEMPVELAELDAFERPRALVEAYDRNIETQSYGYGSRYPRRSSTAVRKTTWEKGNRSIGPSEVPGKETVRVWTAGHDGKLWRPLTSPGKEDFCTVEALLGATADARWFDHPFMSQKDRERIADLKTRDEVLDMKTRETGTDTEESAIGSLLRVASNLAVVDGKVWRVQSDPVWVVGRDRNSVEVNLVRAHNKENGHGVAFRADRLPEALAFAEALSGHLSDASGRKHKVSQGGKRVEFVDPAYLSASAEPASARLVGNAVRRFAETCRNGAAEMVAASVCEALDTRLHRTDMARLVGDPYAFAHRITEWADEARSLPARQGWSNGAVEAFSAGLDEIAAPLLFARDYGLKAEGGDFLTDADLDFLASLGDDFGAPAP